MSTRLDRLFLLLDTGSTPLIRKSAAEQLGEVQKLHPYELGNLLTKVHNYLRSGNWDTRVAAAQAVQAIARNVPQWEPRGAAKQGPAAEGSSVDVSLLFSQFDLEKVLHNGASLLGSEGAQFEKEDKLPDVDDKEKVLHQRQMLNKRLGLDMAGNLKLGIDSDIFSDEDLLTGIKQSQQLGKAMDAKAIEELVHQQIGRSSLSSREKNKAKRKAKMMARQISRDSPVNELDSEPPIKKSKSNGAMKDEKPFVTDSPADTLEEQEDWPFEWFCELLMGDLFSSAWETRHGAASGLREVIKLHGRGAGKSMDTPSDQLSSVNQIFLSDLALRLLCVIALDRFGDFVSDEVVAPVRESCSQTLGVVMKYLEIESIHGVTTILLQLLKQQQWEVRHGGLLGIKYLLAVRRDMTKDLLPTVIQDIFQGLQDEDDDVRAVAASALVPIADDFVTILPQQVPHIVLCLWDTLLDLDDLTASTNSIMTLLSTLMANQTTSVLDWLTKPLIELVPRLWPFLRHSISSVRKSAVEMLHTLLCIESTQHPASAWLSPLLQALLRHVYQRVLLESQPNILDILSMLWSKLLEKSPLDVLVGAATPWLGVWLSLSMQPSKIPYDTTYMIEAKHRGRGEHTSGRGRHSLDAPMESLVNDNQDYIGGFETVNGTTGDRDLAVTRTRVTAARMLGNLCKYICQPVPNLMIPEGEKPLDSLTKLLVFHLNTKSAIQRIVVAEVVYYWALTQECQCPDDLKAGLLRALSEGVYYDEIAMSFTRMQTDCKDFISSLKQQGINMDSIIPPGTILSLEQALTLVTSIYEQIKGAIKSKYINTFEDRKSQLHTTINQTMLDQQMFSIRVQSCISRAVVLLDAVPDKLNPVIRPLMDCIKKEENMQLQTEASKTLCILLRKCLSRDPCPNSKVVKNLCSFLCCDPTYTPVIDQLNNNTSSNEASCDKHKGILTLAKQQKTPELSRKWMRRTATDKAEVNTEMTREEAENQKQLYIQRRGAEVALTSLVQDFGKDLHNKLPTLWETLTKPLLISDEGAVNCLSEESAQETVNSLQVIETVLTALDKTLSDQFVEKLPCFLYYLQSSYTAVRHMAARCLAVISQVSTQEVMSFTVEKTLPLLRASDNDTCRLGAAEAVANILERLGMDVLPYIVLLMVPVLGRMTDQNQNVRTMATHCFATLIRLLPLESGVPDDPGMKPSLLEKKETERKFLEQLMDSSKLENYKVEVPIKAELRKYQQDGINWLGFLNKYNLHGILCDDMGLGKTLQSICIIAGDHYRRQQKYQESQDPDCTPLSSIVICPPSLIGHWAYEVAKFIDKEYLDPLVYAGTPSDRMRLKRKVKKFSLIVASYDVVRNDIEFFSAINWNYCVLDEGHIIKNGKTKISKAVKQLKCNHRLILSGTPIQNNVLDLWSLFDFLVPGFLGTEKQFQARYGKPILASREAKSSSKEQEAGALAMETLHRQVLPFILRRLKEDVLQDLPPKIIQDYYCDLSPLQVKLYEDFAKSQAKTGVNECFSEATEQNKTGSTHVFQALQYLRKVCNHPALVLNTGHPKYAEIMQQLKQDNSSLHDMQHAPKLIALRQLLMDCGIGVDEGSGQSVADTPVVNQHRVLLFCQLKSMLDIVEQDLLKSQMSSVTYLRLDGSVPAMNRHDIVNRFNNDPSIDILLLSTHVGGLGLNLTGADTVIFVEHDWNPMKDLQAMDRAHRIGQKKVVNVYRLVTRGTLEEKIMGLQKFKITIANTVISQDNASLQTMGTDQLLDLFELDDKKKGQSSAPSVSQSEGKKETSKSILEGLGDLWDKSQYESEYDIDAFMTSLAK